MSMEYMRVINLYRKKLGTFELQKLLFSGHRETFYEIKQFGASNVGLSPCHLPRKLEYYELIDHPI